jgi:hypothetical protein
MLLECDTISKGQIRLAIKGAERTVMSRIERRLSPVADSAAWPAESGRGTAVRQSPILKGLSCNEPVTALED